MDSPKEIIKSRLSIEDVVGSYITLIPAGKYWKARCPFHNEKTPSFVVTPDRGTYHCFGCHKGGDIFSFVQEIEGIDFREALVRLADKAGVDVSQNKEFSTEKTDKQVLYEILELATRFYEVTLRQAPDIVTYLTDRGLTKETLKNWRIGYAPDSFRSFIDYASKKYKKEDLVRSGLVIAGDKGYYDRFRDRIMFPIADSQGHIVAFSGRMSPALQAKDGGGGKYINSPETPIYHKSSILYGYHQAKQFLRSENACILVEGQMDLLMLHQNGFGNTVALSGTACTDMQLRLIERFTDTLVISLDQDQAGLRAGLKTAELAYRQGFHVYGMLLPSGKDPADYLREKGKEGWKEVIASKKDFILLRTEELRKRAGDSHDESKDISKEIIPLLSIIPNFILKERLTKQVAAILGASEESIVGEVGRYTSKHPEVEVVIDVPAQRESAKKDPPLKELILSYIGLICAFWEDKYEEKLSLLKAHISPELGIYVDEALSLRERLATEAHVGYSGWTTENVHHAAEEILLRIRISFIAHQIQDAKRQLETSSGDPEFLSRYSALVRELDDLRHKVREFDAAPF